MPGTYTQKPILSGNIVKPDDINEELSGALSKLNGNIDHSNLKTKSIQFTHMKAPIKRLTIDIPNGIYSESVEGVRANHHWTYDGNSKSWSLDDGIVQSGWTPVASKKVDSRLVFHAKEGMLIGSYTINAGKRGTYISAANPQEQGTYHDVPYGYDYWWEVGIFLDNKLIAQSGRIYAGLHIVDIPFSSPIGNQDVVLEARFRFNEKRPTETEYDGLYEDWSGTYSTDFYVHSTCLWCKNQMR